MDDDDDQSLRLGDSIDVAERRKNFTTCRRKDCQVTNVPEKKKWGDYRGQPISRQKFVHINNMGVSLKIQFHRANALLAPGPFPARTRIEELRQDSGSACIMWRASGACPH